MPFMISQSLGVKTSSISTNPGAAAPVVTSASEDILVVGDSRARTAPTTDPRKIRNGYAHYDRPSASALSSSGDSEMHLMPNAARTKYRCAAPAPAAENRGANGVPHRRVCGHVANQPEGRRDDNDLDLEPYLQRMRTVLKTAAGGLFSVSTCSLLVELVVSVKK